MSYGVITEQGDLGLGFQEMDEQEEKTVKESFANQPEEEDEKK